MNRTTIEQDGRQYEFSKWLEYEDYLNSDEIAAKRECDMVTSCEKNTCRGCKWQR